MPIYTLELSEGNITLMLAVNATYVGGARDAMIEQVDDECDGPIKTFRWKGGEGWTLEEIKQRIRDASYDAFERHKKSEFSLAFGCVC